MSQEVCKKFQKLHSHILHLQDTKKKQLHNVCLYGFVISVFA